MKLMNISNDCVPVHKSSRLIAFPPDFANLISTKDELITNVFSNIVATYNKLELLSERAIFAVKNKDVHDLNIIIQDQIVGTLQ